MFALFISVLLLINQFSNVILCCEKIYNSNKLITFEIFEFIFLYKYNYRYKYISNDMISS